MKICMINLKNVIMIPQNLIGKISILLIIFFIFSNSVNSQSMKIYNEFKTASGDVNYISPYLVLEQDTTSNNFVNQLKYTYSSYIHKKINKPLFKKREIQIKINYKTAQNRILKCAKLKRVVMFNEEHHNPLHRLYVETFLINLKKQGFTILALETLSWKDKELNSRGFPIATSGGYTVEPYFSNLVRKALELGFKVLPYETKVNGSSSIESREENQANNLVKIFKQEKGKILILAGYSHISEAPIISHNGNKIKWMAALLKDKLKIDPLTIDQTEISSSEKIKEVSIPYKNKKPYILSNYKDRYDIHLVYPKKTEYLHYDLGKEKIRISINPKYVSKNYLIQFYIDKEYLEYKNKAIPYEQFLIEDLEMTTYLNSKRSYQLIIRNENYKIIFQKQVNNLNKNIFIN